MYSSSFFNKLARNKDAYFTVLKPRVNSASALGEVSMVAQVIEEAACSVEDLGFCSRLVKLINV